MIPIWNSRIACSDGGRFVCSLWAFSADFRVLWVSPLSWRFAVLETPTPFSRVRYLSCQITSPLHFPLCMGLIRLLMFHTSLASPPFTELDGRLSPQSTAISPLAGALAPPPSAGHRTQRLRLWTASFPRSRRLSRPAHSATDGGGRRRFGGVTDFCRQPLLFGLALGFVGRP